MPQATTGSVVTCNAEARQWSERLLGCLLAIVTGAMVVVSVEHFARTFLNIELVAESSLQRGRYAVMLSVFTIAFGLAVRLLKPIVSSLTGRLDDLQLTTWTASLCWLMFLAVMTLRSSGVILLSGIAALFLLVPAINQRTFPQVTTSRGRAAAGAALISLLLLATYLYFFHLLKMTPLDTMSMIVLAGVLGVLLLALEIITAGLMKWLIYWVSIGWLIVIVVSFGQNAGYYLMMVLVASLSANWTKLTRQQQVRYIWLMLAFLTSAACQAQQLGSVVLVTVALICGGLVGRLLLVSRMREDVLALAQRVIIVDHWCATLMMVLVVLAIILQSLPLLTMLALSTVFIFADRWNWASQLVTASTFEHRQVSGPSRLIIFLLLAAAVVRLTHWFTTERVWEDTLITIQHAENAARGLGLTHHPAHGRVHGFTSPISVLLPLAGEMIIPGSAVNVMRVVSISAGLASVWFLFLIARRREFNWSMSVIAFVGIYLSFEHSQVLFGMAGLETQIWTAILLGGAWAYFADSKWLPVFLSLALWARPDGVVWAGTILGAIFCFRPMHACKITALTVLGYLPWLVFTVAYYGSPVPNTIVAKAAGYIYNTQYHFRYPTSLHLTVRELPEAYRHLLMRLSPYYVGHGLLPIAMLPFSVPINLLNYFLMMVGLVILGVRGKWGIVLYLCLYTVFLLIIVHQLFPWYLTPFLAIMIFFVGQGMQTIRTMLLSPRARRLFDVIAWSLAILWIVPLPKQFYTDLQVQRVQEDGVRRQVGLWLKEHAQPEDYVSAECLGYLGYYSRLPFHDYPGLSSPRVVAVMKKQTKDAFLTPIVKALKPRWIVLRSTEPMPVGVRYKLRHQIYAKQEDVQLLNRYIGVGKLDAEFRIFEIDESEVVPDLNQVDAKRE